MTTAVAISRQREFMGRPHATRMLVWLALIVIAAMMLLPGIPEAMKIFPKPWMLPINQWVSAFVNWLLRDFHIGPVAFRDITRALGFALEAPVLLLQRLLAKGFEFEVSGNTISLPPLSWAGIVIAATALAATLRTRWLTLLVAGTLLYVGFIGLWQSAMMTMALVLIAVVVGVISGLLLGIGSFRSPVFHRILSPVLDFMQTVPVFGYLVPAILMFGYSPAAALVITLIYTVPPMVRITRNALDHADPETVELGHMAGCSSSQILWKIMLPSQRPRLMLGVNQVIMLTLNMVIVTSLIGAGGLGYDVWQAVKSLHIGRGAEAGFAITLIAISLDRLSQQYASRRLDHRIDEVSFLRRQFFIISAAIAALLLTALSIKIPALGQIPESAILSSGRFWDGIVDWINLNAYAAISTVRDTIFVYVLRPTKTLVLALPWAGVILLLAALGYRLGGFRLAVLGVVLPGFIALAGQWEKAMTSVYLVGVAFLIAAFIGVPLGFAAMRNERRYKIVELILDTLQTLPSFVYLIPVVMLLGVGDFSALVAIVLYAIAPAVRYTAAAIGAVPAPVIEAANAVGATRRQIRHRVIVPLAMPGIVLGLNQTLMLGISMLVITALVGTRDLGQETLIALSQSDPGRGLVAGICVAFIAILANAYLLAVADKQKKRLGLHD
jgi:glycine betaine/proline transport system permease protein